MANAFEVLNVKGSTETFSKHYVVFSEYGLPVDGRKRAKRSTEKVIYDFSCAVLPT
jgi:hypothetical protein